MKTSCQVATVCGIPVRLDISLLALMGIICVVFFRNGAGLLNALLQGTTWALLLLLSIILHELGHCLISIRYGCRVRSITLMLLGGRAELTHFPTQPGAELLIAAAGPLVSLALWLGGHHGAAYFASQPPSVLTQYAGSAMTALAYLNVSLFWFNLVPAFPMDGGRILRALLAHRLGRLHATRIAVNIGRVLTLGTILWLLTGQAQVNIEAHHWNVFGWEGSFNAVHLTINRWILGLIALFVFFAAEQEYHTVLLEAEYHRNGQRAPWLPPLAPEDQIVVSPPPYHRGSVDFRADRDKPRWWQWWA